MHYYESKMSNKLICFGAHLGMTLDDSWCFVQLSGEVNHSSHMDVAGWVY